MLAAACIGALLWSLPVVTLGYSPVSTVLLPRSFSLLSNPLTLVSLWSMHTTPLCVFRALCDSLKTIHSVQPSSA